MRKELNYIGGEWVSAKSGRTFEILNPADTREVVAEYPASGKEDVIDAVNCARDAFKKWSGMTAVARGRYLSRASWILDGRKEELARELTREEGKTYAESLAEVQRAIDIFRYYGGLSYTLGGQTIPHDQPDNLLYTVREPIGVFGLITPWNFPIAIPAWKLAPALVCGNTVVLKPATQAPGMAIALAKALAEAGLPAGVLNVVTGSGRDAGNELVSNPAVAGVSFTGSYQIGQQIYQTLAGRMARAQMEMGGKNPTIVLTDADIDLAVSLTVRAGFGLTGQACTATSRVIVERAIENVFIEKLVQRARSIKVGNGLTAGVEMGPAVSRQQLETDLEYIQIALQEGAKLLCGGHRIESGDYKYGYFIEPTVFGGVKPNWRIAQEEVFGPVLAIITVDNFDEAIEVANSVEMGLSASIVTRDIKKAMLYARRIQAGVVKINQVSTGLALQAPFGGVKKSSTDTFKEQGIEGLNFYSRIKTVYLDYSN